MDLHLEKGTTDQYVVVSRRLPHESRYGARDPNTGNDKPAGRGTESISSPTIHVHVMTATLLYIPLFFILFLVDRAAAVWPFPSKRFTGSSLLEAGPLGITQEGRVVAFGDFNGDQL